MGNVAQLFPYRDADNRLMFRGKIGVSGGNGVSKFFPVRVDGRLMLRGKGADGKVLWAFPHVDASGRLMGRTLRLTSCSCRTQFPYPLSVTVSGLPSTICPASGIPQMSSWNRSWTLGAWSDQTISGIVYHSAVGAAISGDFNIYLRCRAACNSSFLITQIYFLCEFGYRSESGIPYGNIGMFVSNEIRSDCEIAGRIYAWDGSNAQKNNGFGDIVFGNCAAPGASIVFP